MHILNEVVQEIEEAKASEETYYIYDETESINNTNNYSIILNDDILDEDAIEVKIENISDDIIRLNNNNGLHNTSPNVIIDLSSSTNESCENNSTNNQSSVSSSIILCSDSSQGPSQNELFLSNGNNNNNGNDYSTQNEMNVDNDLFDSRVNFQYIEG